MEGPDKFGGPAKTLSPLIFNINLKYHDDDIGGGSPIKFADDRKLRSTTCPSMVRSRIKNELNKLED